MHTYFLGTEEVSGYVRDFVQRLKNFEQIPTVWCPVTVSGDGLLQAILAQVRKDYPELLKTVQLLPIEIEVDDGATHILFVKEKPDAVIPGKPVLLLDSAIHSGQMMRRCADEVLRHGPTELCSYALVIKRSSVFIPTLWGLMIDEADRAYFLLDKIPNNRLNAGAKRPQPPVLLQRLNESHLAQPLVNSGVKSIGRMTWSDRHYQMQTAGVHTCTYVLERTQTIVGFLTVHSYAPDSLTIGEIVVDQRHQKHGYGGMLLRFADTLARQANCRIVRLHAIKEQIEFYEHFGYRLAPGGQMIRLDDEGYQWMERTVLYHQGPLR